MIFCHKCQRQYADDATYCNHCQLALDSTNSSNAFDQKQLLQKQRLAWRTKRRIKWLFTASTALMLIFSVQSFLKSETSQPYPAILLLLVAIGCGISLWLLNRPAISKLKYYLVGITACMILVFPFGTLLGAAIVIQLLMWDD